MRRVRYLEQVGFIVQAGGRWQLGVSGQEYASGWETETLFGIMANRNVGLRSLLYELVQGPMDIEAVSEQQLDTHPELGWARGETDMAKQRVNWLRSMGLIRRQDGRYTLTERGQTLVGEAVAEWEDERLTQGPAEAGIYETTTTARSLDPEFRATVLTRYDETCPVSGVDHAGLLDVAHVLPWSEYPSHRADPTNVLALGKTHHAAFDRGLFTIDADHRLRVNPSFETDSEHLRRTLVQQAGDRLPRVQAHVDPDHLARHNDRLDWM